MTSPWPRRPLPELLIGALGRSERAVQALPLLFPALARTICTRAGLDRSVLLEDQKGFDAAYYEQLVGRPFRSPDDALFHYVTIGSRRGLKPRADFDPAGYRQRNPDVDRAGYEPFAHYLRFGRIEGRGGSAEADTASEATLLPNIERLLSYSPPRTRIATVDVVVPVYGSRHLTLQTIESVLAASGTTIYELIVVDDASPDPVLREELRRLAERGLVTVLTNERNIGFVGSANRGLTCHSDRDVVLLNSDTRVFDGWLDRLLGALRRAPRIGTATPFSNAATIFSYPVTLKDNRRLRGMDFRLLDQACAELRQPIVDVPTAVGFCMAINRACLDEVGVFDAERFGRGYGEENDFCLRASASGWRNIAATELFVWHHGGGSFGPEKEARITAALATMEELHPGYGAMIHDFICRDPLEPARAALDAARIRADPRPKCLSVGGQVEVKGAPTDVLTLALVPDIAPFFGQYRLVAPGFTPVPNLRRIGRDTTPVDLHRMMDDLAIRELRLCDRAPLVSPLRRSLEMAAAAAGVAVRSGV